MIIIILVVTFSQCRKPKVMTCAPPLALNTGLSGEKEAGKPSRGGNKTQNYYT